MYKTMKGFLMVAVALGLSLPAMGQATKFFDISRPGIQKLAIHVEASEKSPANDQVVGDLRNLLTSTLMFDAATDKASAAFSLTMDKSVEAKELLFTLKEEAGSTGFEPIYFGVRLRDTEPPYVRLKVAQIGNTVVQRLFGVRGSLGSTVVWSSSDSDDPVKALRIGEFGYGNDQQLTYNLFSNLGASWNPERDTIVFTSHTAKGTQVMVQRTNPVRAKQISVFEDGGRGSSSYWSPDGTIFLSLFVEDKNTDIFQFSLEGDPYQAANARLKEIRKLTDAKGIDTEPAISPDGKSMAFTSDRGGSPQIYVMDLGSSNTRRVSRNGGYNASPAWSPDGRYLAYFGIRSGEVSIFRLDMSGGDEQRLTSGNIKAETPTWSPDGSMIAFKGESGRDKSKIYYMLSTGGEYRRLTGTGPNIIESDPSWGPALR